MLSIYFAAGDCKAQCAGADTQEGCGLCLVHPPLCGTSILVEARDFIVRAQRGDTHTGPTVAAAGRQTTAVQCAGDQVIRADIGQRSNGIDNLWRRVRAGLPTGRGNRWSRERVTSLRTHHEIPCFNKERCSAAGWMNQTQAAAFLDISAGALRLAVSRGEIEAQHPLPDGPWVFNRRALQTTAASNLVRRIKAGRQDSAARNLDQSTFEFSKT